jgi:hypothetical protein
MIVTAMGTADDSDKARENPMLSISNCGRRPQKAQIDNFNPAH